MELSEAELFLLKQLIARYQYFKELEIKYGAGSVGNFHKNVNIRETYDDRDILDAAYHLGKAGLADMTFYGSEKDPFCTVTLTNLMKSGKFHDA